MPIEFGRVPHPPMQIRSIEKPEGQGWDNLGKRTPRGIVLHRMIGTLWGTDGYFRQPGVNSLTDYGVGVAATDGLAKAGQILRWNDPRGSRSGWASGPVSKPYGDGLAFVNRYGIVGVNRDTVSVEISGNYDTPLDAQSKAAIAGLLAYWGDQYRIPHDQFPWVPSEGRNFTLWHQEFTIGTGKICPGPVVMNGTDELIVMARAIMKRHQEVGTAYATPAPQPIAEGWDAVLNGMTYHAVSRRVLAKGGAAFRSLADTGAPETRAKAAVGEAFTVQWAVFVEGVGWWVTPHGSRIRMADTNVTITVAKS